MADAIKFTEEELKSIKDLQNDYNKAVFALGQLTYQLDNLSKQKENIMNGLEQVRGKENDLAKTFNSKYGVGSLDLETGTFTPQD
jgi:chromosome segregation ATPase